ncbi:MAG TPA: LptF/LptG family permease [Spirochaetota bacterium]|nr:LptF/LptG family permease [Spirochaetota bacterium]
MKLPRSTMEALAPRIITRYIIREQVPALVIGLLFFTFIMMLNRIFTIADLIINRRVDGWLVFKLFLYMLPITISFTVPMSVLISAVMALSRLSVDSEITALRACGVSVYRIIKPVLVSGFVVFLMVLAFNETLFVYSNRTYNQLFVQILRSSPTSVLEPKMFTTVGDKTIWVGQIEREVERLGDIMIYNRNPAGGWDIIRAQEGLWKQNADGSKSLIMYRGKIFSSDFDKATFSYLDFSNGSAEVLMTESKIDYTEDRDVINPHEHDSAGLLARLRAHPKSYRNDRNVALNWIEFFKKHAVPFSCFVFSVIGAPIGIFSTRSGRGVGFGVSIFIFFAYYVFFVGGQSMAVRGDVHPALGVWFTNFLFMLIGVLLIVFKERLDTANIDIHALAGRWQALVARFRKRRET